MGELGPWTWMEVIAAWASVILLFGAGLSLQAAQRMRLRKIGRSIMRLSVGAAFATGAYAAYFVLQH
jgi:Kef-type K+ transport system membrane component KefB